MKSEAALDGDLLAVIWRRRLQGGKRRLGRGHQAGKERVWHGVTARRRWEELKKCDNNSQMQLVGVSSEGSSTDDGGRLEKRRVLEAR